ncbi:MAG: hypothetical protein JZU60_00265 [Ilumatobacteraceae bacterium]|nr:hypothetical protein [Ilumatobacteraceae bacterium]
MKHVLNPTTKRFSRSLSQAFPGGYEYAASIERSRANDHSGIAIVLICGIVLAVAIVGTWMGNLL